MSDERGGTGAGGKSEAGRALRFLVPVFSLALFLLASWVLYRELRNLPLRDTAHYFRRLPVHRWILALLSSAASYFMLMGYDIVALRHIGRPLGWSKTALAGNFSFGLESKIKSKLTVTARLDRTFGKAKMPVTRLVGTPENFDIDLSTTQIQAGILYSFQ